MKFTSIICVTLCFALLAVVSVQARLGQNAHGEQVELQFKDWMKTHKKSYTAAEFPEKIKKFADNLVHYSKMAEMTGAVYGPDRFSDMTHEEFQATYLMEKFDAGEACVFNDSRIIKSVKNVRGQATPSAWDWTAQSPSPVGPVKDQGQCGSCWAFSTVAAMEGMWAMAGNPVPDLSEEELTDCSMSCQESTRACNAGCSGGLPWLAYGDVASWPEGSVSESDYPYTAINGNTGACNKYGKKEVASVSDWKAIDVDQQTIQDALYNMGPLSVTLNANLLFGYTTGVINTDPSNCPYYGMDHAVTLVGFGQDGNTNYWKIKNSWAATWGEEGYFRIAADQDLCGIWDCTTVPIVGGN
jgi:C1A family cysteine protease